MQGLREFDYLLEVARTFGGLYFRDEFNSFAENISDVQTLELGRAYEMIAAKQDSGKISQWIQECNDNSKHVGRKELLFSRQMGQLFLLFGYLAARQITPFASGEVTLVKKRQSPNWNTLPEDIKYIKDIAEKYEIYSESDALSVVENAKEEEIESLAAIAERIRLNGHMNAINEWLDRFPIDKHNEAWRVYTVLLLMDHAGLEFD